MLIKVKLPGGEQEEWTILEFQGTFSGDCAGEELGVLELTPEGKVTIDIGLHTLNGRVIEPSSHNVFVCNGSLLLYLLFFSSMYLFSSFLINNEDRNVASTHSDFRR